MSYVRQDFTGSRLSLLLVNISTFLVTTKNLPHHQVSNYLSFFLEDCQIFYIYRISHFTNHFHITLSMNIVNLKPNRYFLPKKKP